MNEIKSELLIDLGLTENDIMKDENGNYVMVEADNGHPMDKGYEVKLEKYYPLALQEDYVPDLKYA